LKALSLSNLFLFRKPHTSQIEKFVKAVTSLGSPSDLLNSYVVSGSRFIPRAEVRRPTPILFEEARRSGSTFLDRTMVLSDNPIPTPFSVDLLFRDLLRGAFRKPFRYWLRFFPELFHPLDREVYDAGADGYKAYDWRRSSITQFKEDGTPRDLKKVYAGSICATQEPGGKLRVYANPVTFVQCALRPLQRALYKVQKATYPDCTSDQYRGALFALTELQKGNKIFSFDLSNATDRFPREPQIGLMRILGVPELYIKVFEQLCTLPWKVEPGLVSSGFPEELTWEVGQPLGVYGSFPIFSLTHIALLYGIEVAMLGRPHRTFRVVGDDVVISNEKVAREYSRVLSISSVEISQQKSLESSYLASFVGYYITKDTMTKPTKLRPIRRKNVVESAMALGSTAVDAVASVEPKILPMAHVPKALGGFGWPSGMSFEEKFASDESFARLIMAIIQRVPSLTGIDQYRHLRLRELVAQEFLGTFGYSLKDFKLPFYEIESTDLESLLPFTLRLPPTLRLSHAMVTLQVRINELRAKLPVNVNQYHSLEAEAYRVQLEPILALEADLNRLKRYCTNPERWGLDSPNADPLKDLLSLIASSSRSGQS
jgi:hypothetical protein